MTFAQRFEQIGFEKGRQEGRQVGRQEGRLEGMKEGTRNIFILLLKEKFGTVPDNYLNLAQNAKEPILLSWTAQVLFANTIQEIFEKELSANC